MFEEQLNLPYGVAVDGAGAIYVTDVGDQRVYKSFGDALGYFGSAGRFISPIGVAVDKIAGYVYVVDSNQHHVFKFSNAGTLITTWGGLGSGDGQFNLPAGVAVDSDGNIYVTDFYNQRFQKFSSEGVFLSKTTIGQLTSPRGIAVDSAGSSSNRC